MISNCRARKNTTGIRSAFIGRPVRPPRAQGDATRPALLEHGPCPQHRMRFVNVRRAAGLEPLADLSATSVGSAGVGEQSGTTPGTEEEDG